MNEKEVTMINTLNIYATPTEIFERLKERPDWKSPFFVLIGAIAVMAWFKSCLKAESIVFDFAILLTTVIGSAAVILCLWSFIAMLIYFGSSLLEKVHTIGFKGSLSIVAYSTLILLLGEIVNFLLVRTGLLDTSAFPLPKRVPVGLDILLWNQEANPLLSTLLHSVNIFIVWYLVVLGMGIHIVTGLNKVKSTTLAVMIWAVGIGFVLGIVHLAGGTTVRINIG